MDHHDTLQERARAAAGVILHSRHVVALVGAGLSVESGVPPFRGPGGLWNKYGEPSAEGYRRFLSDPRGGGRGPSSAAPT